MTCYLINYYGRKLTLDYNSIEDFENQTLGLGEFAVYHTTNDEGIDQVRLKIGDGSTTPIKALPFVGFSSDNNVSIDFSNITQDVTIAEGCDLTVGGDLNINGALSFGELAGTSLTADYVSIMAAPEADTHAINKSYFEQELGRVEEDLTSKLDSLVESYVNNKLLSTQW